MKKKLTLDAFERATRQQREQQRAALQAAINTIIPKTPYTKKQLRSIGKRKLSEETIMRMHPLHYLMAHPKDFISEED